MASRYWIKLYHEILDDPKMGRLSDTLFRRTIELFLIAGDVDKEGLLPSIADISWRLRIPESTLQGEMERLRVLGILTMVKSGIWVVTHFKERQSAEPPSKRMRRYRESLQKVEGRYDSVTKRNADIDVDKDAEDDRDRDADEENAVSVCSPEDELVRTFVEHTSIPFNTGGEGKWAKALARLRQAEVEKEDIVSALGECYQKGIVIANLSSIVNPAIISMARRKSGKTPPDPEDYTRYIKGKYGDIGLH